MTFVSKLHNNNTLIDVCFTSYLQGRIHAIFKNLFLEKKYLGVIDYLFMNKFIIGAVSPFNLLCHFHLIYFLIVFCLVCHCV